jgi:hypothetical protein
MSIPVWKWAEREPFRVGPLPRATPACMHAGGPARGNPAGRGLREMDKLVAVPVREGLYRFLPRRGV